MALSAPQVTHCANHTVVEEGAWRTSKLRQARTYHLHPWQTPEALSAIPSQQRPARVQADPLDAAQQYQNLLDGGVVKSRAELARYLNVSRARVTQVLRRLTKPPSKSSPSAFKPITPVSPAGDT